MADDAGILIQDAFRIRMGEYSVLDSEHRGARRKLTEGRPTMA